MLELFKVVTKFEHGQFQKLSVIDKYVDIIFKDNSTANAPLINRNTTDISDSEDSDDEEEDIVVTENLEHVEKTVAADDLSSKQINALISVSLMFSTSKDLKIDINYLDVKNKLYGNVKDSIPEEKLKICTRFINAIRKICNPGNAQSNISSYIAIRHLRNVIVDFAGKLTKYNSSSISIQKSKKESVEVDCTTLYYLFQKDYKMYNSKGEFFTNGHSIKSAEQKADLLQNIFDWKLIKRLLNEHNLSPNFTFKYTDQYNLHLIGKKSTSLLPPQKIPAEKKKQTTSADSIYIRDTKDLIGQLSSSIDQNDKHLAILNKELKIKETERRDLARSFRQKEKSGSFWDSELYARVKRKREECDEIYTESMSLSESTNRKKRERYALNKGLYHQPIMPNYSESAKGSELIDSNTVIQSIDPGIVTTASISTCKALDHQKSIDRYEFIYNKKSDFKSGDALEYRPGQSTFFELTAPLVNHVTFSNLHRRQREKKQKEKEKSCNKHVARRKLCRKIRSNRFYAKLYTSQRRKGFLSCSKKRITFLGNWSRNGKYIKGHTRRSLNPYLSRIKSIEKDCLSIVDEFGSTVTCNSCFSKTKKQTIRKEDGKLKSVKGAVVCINPSCPARIHRNQTTTNRDQNGAKNIGLIGISMMTSEDGRPIPPFRRSF